MPKKNQGPLFQSVDQFEIHSRAACWKTLRPGANSTQMVKNHPFTIAVEPDLLRDGRFRWTLYEKGQPRNRSPVSYATRREAIADATKALKKQIADRRSVR